MTKIKYIVLLSLLTANLSASAEIDCVVVCDKEDKETIIPIKDASEITFDANLMAIGSEVYNMNLLKKYYFADSEALGVEEITGEIPGLKIDPTGLISFSSMTRKDDVEVYNLAGIPQSFTNDGNVIDIRNLQPDVYVVKIGAASIKFVKK
ncbi:MAG: T9SS type A sorting domain-containing protein [Bacteroides sp.]|nr:T9SS type A sorting domain-containing protein [Bacteroides sp.]